MSTDGAAEGGTQTGHEVSGTDTDSARIMPNAVLVCFSGKIGSGKTSTSVAVAKALGCGYTSFGGYLSNVLAARGSDPDCRELLQDLGQYRIEQDAEAFCRDVLAAGGFVPGEDFVLDGVRHVDVLPHLIRMAAPSEMRMIYLETDSRLRSIRVGERSATESEDFDRASSHVVEADMTDKLPLAADAIVDSSLTSRAVIERCIGLIDSWRWAGACIASTSGVEGAAGKT